MIKRRKGRILLLFVVIAFLGRNNVGTLAFSTTSDGGGSRFSMIARTTRTTTRKTTSTPGDSGDIMRHFSSSSSSSSPRTRPAMAARAVDDNYDDLILIPPPTTNQVHDDDATTAQASACLILIPGCQLRPAQYEPLARAIQAKSSHKRRLYIGVSSQPGGLANPHTIAASVAATYRSLQRAGYRGRSAFVGGHSVRYVVLL
jgi:hypothetical protein